MSKGSVAVRPHCFLALPGLKMSAMCFLLMDVGSVLRCHISVLLLYHLLLGSFLLLSAAAAYFIMSD